MLILLFIPDQHQSFSYVFTERFNNSGLQRRQHVYFGFWFAIVPFGFLLTQYTITGFDASAHLSEETASASKAAAKGIWRSILYSVIGGYILLLAWSSPSRTTPTATLTTPGRRWRRRLHLHRGPGTDWAGTSSCCSSRASAQFFCATSCMTWRRG